MNILSTCALFLALILASGCLDASKPTQEQLRMIKNHILTQVPEIRYEVNASLEGKVTYLGLNVDPGRAQPGKVLNLTHYWQVHTNLDGWKIFVHLNSPKKERYINADHTPIEGLYPASLWKPNEIIQDEHKVTLPLDWNFPEVLVYTGLWMGDLRMQVNGPQDGDNRILAAKIPVQDAPAVEQKQLVAIQALKTIHIDGKLNEGVWAQAPSSEPFTDSMSGEPAPIRTIAKVAWDPKNLYVAFECQDQDIWSAFKNRDENLWTQEAVEVYIDADGDKQDYIELQVSPRGVIFDSYFPRVRQNQNDFNSRTEVAVSIDGTLDNRDDQDQSWTVELAIPWKDTQGRSTGKLRLPPKIGDVWRVNFFRMDAPKNKPQIASAWSAPLTGDFHVLDRFGTLVFADRKGKFPTLPGKGAKNKVSQEHKGKPKAK